MRKLIVRGKAGCGKSRYVISEIAYSHLVKGDSVTVVSDELDVKVIIAILAATRCYHMHKVKVSIDRILEGALPIIPKKALEWVHALMRNSKLSIVDCAGSNIIDTLARSKVLIADNLDLTSDSTVQRLLSIVGDSSIDKLIVTSNTVVSTESLLLSFDEVETITYDRNQRELNIFREDNKFHTPYTQILAADLENSIFVGGYVNIITKEDFTKDCSQNDSITRINADTLCCEACGAELEPMLKYDMNFCPNCGREIIKQGGVPGYAYY